MKKFAFLLFLAADNGGGGGAAKKVEESKKDSKPPVTVTPPPVVETVKPPAVEVTKPPTETPVVVDDLARPAAPLPPNLPPPMELPPSAYAPTGDAFTSPAMPFGAVEKSLLPETQPTVVVAPGQKALDDSCVRL